jgi:protein-tyrosine phosphatase
MKKIVFVCTANICRSPSAEHYLRHVADKLGGNGLEVSSVGVMGLTGHPADSTMSRLLAQRGLDLSSHESRGVELDEMQQADQIVVMTKRHRAWFRENMPEVLPKVILLREYLDGARDLSDPVGGSEGEYRTCLDMICRCVEQMAISLKYPQ